MNFQSQFLESLINSLISSRFLLSFHPLPFPLSFPVSLPLVSRQLITKKGSLSRDRWRVNVPLNEIFAVILQGEVSRTGRGMEDEYLSLGLSTFEMRMHHVRRHSWPTVFEITKTDDPWENGLEIKLKRIRFDAKSDANVSYDVVHSVSDLIGSDRNRTNHVDFIVCSTIIQDCSWIYFRRIDSKRQKKRERCCKYLDKTFIN